MNGTDVISCRTSAFGKRIGSQARQRKPKLLMAHQYSWSRSSSILEKRQEVAEEARQRNIQLHSTRDYLQSKARHTHIPTFGNSKAILSFLPTLST
jgi:hypothetical protein